jgi:hypothetical protein
MTFQLPPLAEIATEEGRTAWVWGAVLGTVMWVILQSEELRVVRKIGEGAASGVLGITAGPALAEWASAPVLLCAVAVTAFAPGLLLGIRRALSSQQVILQILRRVIGK